MKTLFLSLLLICSSLAYAQCDEQLTADPGTYQVEMNPEKVDATNAPVTLVNCAHLLQIEASREDDKDVTLELGNYIVRVFSKNKVLNPQLSQE
jgi:hypothetical protein